jgi:cellulose synthase operon protein C
MRHTVFMLILLALAACSGGSKEQHLARARDYIAQSKFPSATSELQSALKMDAKSAEIRWLLGKVHLETGHAPEAEYELQQAQSLGWTRDDIRPAMAQALLAQGKFQEVIALDFRDLGATSAAQLLSSQALAAVSSQQLDKAQELAFLALRKDPQLLQAKLAVATILVNRGDVQNAVTLVDKILESNPENGAAWGLKGQVLRLQGKLDEARAAFDKSIAHSPMAFADRVARGLINLQLGEFAAAQEDATALLELSPDDPAANYIQGLLDFQNKQYRKAITALTLAEPAAEQFPLVRYYLGKGYLIENELDPAEQFAKLFAKDAPDHSGGRKLLAAILLQKNRLDEALDILQPVLDHDPDDLAALNIKANALLLKGQVDKGLVLYSLMQRLQSDWRVVPLRKEAVLVVSGPGNEPVQVPGAGPDATENFPQTDILLILQYLGNKDFKGAIEAAKSYQFRDIESVAPYAVLGRVYLAADKIMFATNTYMKALKREPADSAANQGLARAALAMHRPNTARKYYQAILASHESDLDTLLQLAALEEKQKNVSAMVAALEDATAAHRDALEPRLKLAEYYMGAGHPEKVAPLFAKLSALQQTAPRVLDLMSRAYVALQQYDSAQVSLQQLVDARPEVVQNRYLLATVATRTGDTQTAKQQLLEVVKRDPKHQPALIDLARITQGEGDQEQFKQYVAALVALAPDAPEVLRLRALAASAAGDHTEALELARRAYKLAPATPTLLQLTDCQKAAGYGTVARNTLQRWLATHPTDVDVRHALARDFELANNPVGAKAQYVAILAQQPNNTLALNRLALILRVNNPVQALATIRRALSVAPDQPDLLDTLAVIELQTGDYESAQHSLQRALQGSPGNLSMRYHQAQIDAARGEKARAIAILEELTAPQSNTFPEQAEAKKLLLSMKD